MRILYVDEAGGGEPMSPGATNVSPVFCIVGVIIDQARLDALTRDYLDLKKRHFPGLFAGRPFLDGMRKEVKGGELRRELRAAGRKERRATLAFLDRTVALLEKHGCLSVGRVWVKEPGKELNERSIYTSSIQDLCRHYQHHLSSADDTGLMICDSRSSSLNSGVSHSIFTQKFQAGGDPFDRLVEMPVFSHSDNHAGLQLADILVSGLIFPMACRAYCAEYLSTHHVDKRYEVLRQRYGTRLQRLQYRYSEASLWRGGIVVSDPVGNKGGGLLFRNP